MGTRRKQWVYGTVWHSLVKRVLNPTVYGAYAIGGHTVYQGCTASEYHGLYGVGCTTVCTVAGVLFCGLLLQAACTVAYSRSSPVPGLSLLYYSHCAALVVAASMYVLASLGLSYIYKVL